MNREVVGGGGASIYPLTGDVTSTAGNTPVAVTGLQGVPIQAINLQGGEVVMYDPNLHNWVPTIRAAIQVNGLTVSDDSIITVNKTKQVLVNGV